MPNDRYDDDVIVISEEDVIYETPGDPTEDSGPEASGPGHGDAMNADLDASDEATTATPAETETGPHDSGPDGPGPDDAGPPEPGTSDAAAERGAPGTGMHAVGAGWPDASGTAGPHDADASDATAAPASPAAAPGSQAAAPASPAAVEARWPEIQALFVDDPRSAVRQAADVMSGAVTALVAAARNREETLTDSWQADGTGTEELRTALRQYRDLSARLAEVASQI